MTTVFPKTSVAHCTRLFARPLLESVLLDITHSLETEMQHKPDNGKDIRRLAKARLRILPYVRAVQNRDGHRHRPDPDHLKHPEAQKGEKLVPLVVESVIFPRLQDTEEEEARESCGPEHEH